MKKLGVLQVPDMLALPNVLVTVNKSSMAAIIWRDGIGAKSSGKTESDYNQERGCQVRFLISG